MTPQEKAQELIGKCYDIFINDEDEYYTGTAWRLSKECALIVVDEIRNILSMPNIPKYYPIVTDEYWEQVKQEIEKL